MSIDVSAETVIERPRSEVAAYVMNPDNDPVWIGGIVEAKTLTEPPFGMGTKVERTAKFLGRRMVYTPEVVEYEPDALLVMKAASPFPMTVRYEFADAGGATEVRIRVQGGGGGFYRLAEPVLARSVKRNITKDLERLRDRLGPSSL